MDNEGYKLTKHEIEVLKMANGDTPWPPNSAWVNACVEFLSGAGYVTRGGDITEKGKTWLKENPDV